MYRHITPITKHALLVASTCSANLDNSLTRASCNLAVWWDLGRGLVWYCFLLHARAGDDGNSPFLHSMIARCLCEQCMLNRCLECLRFLQAEKNPGQQQNNSWQIGGGRAYAALLLIKGVA